MEELKTNTPEEIVPTPAEADPTDVDAIRERALATQKASDEAIRIYSTDKNGVVMLASEVDAALDPANH